MAQRDRTEPTTNERNTASLTRVFRQDGGSEMGNASWRCALVASLAFFVCAFPALPSAEQEGGGVQGSVSQVDPLSIGDGPYWGRSRARSASRCDERSARQQ